MTNLKQLRIAQGLTQQALANAAGINISQVQKIEAGTINIANVTLINAVNIARALGVSAEDLMKEDK